MGSSLFGGGTTKTNSITNQSQTSDQSSNTNNTSRPADFQMPFIQGGLDVANNYIQHSSPFQPQAYTGLSPETLSALNNLTQFANGGKSYADGMMSTGSGVLNPAIQLALQGASRAQTGASTDGTASNIADAARYADNPYTAGMIKAAQTPIERQLKEVSIPGLNIAGSNSGNLDSSRSAMTEAILRRSAGEDESNIASNILGQQYATGLNLAESGRVANLNSLLAGVSAANGVAGTGSNLVTTGNSIGVNDLGAPISAGQLVQQDANSRNQVDYNNALTAGEYPWMQLGHFWDIAGHPLGQTTTGSASGTSSGTVNGVTDTTKTDPGPGVLGGVLGLASGIGSMFMPTGPLGLGPSMFSSISKGVWRLVRE
jgi:hypothetical protein